MNPVTEAQYPAAKKGWGCLHWLALFAGIIFLLMLIGGILVYQTVDWVARIPETTPVTYPKLNLSAGEEADVNAVWLDIGQGMAQGSHIDESVTPNVLNGVFEKIIEDQRRQGNLKNGEQVAVRVSFEGDDLVLKSTMESKDPKTPAGMYINAEIHFNGEIANSKVEKLEVSKFMLHGQEAPFIARVVINAFVSGLVSGQKQGGTSDPNFPKDVGAIIALKRDGDKLHFVLDGKKMKEEDDRKKSMEKKNVIQPQVQQGKKPEDGSF